MRNLLEIQVELGHLAKWTGDLRHLGRVAGSWQGTFRWAGIDA